MITTEIPAWEDPPAMPKSNYRASGLVHRPKADIAGTDFVTQSIARPRQILQWSRGRAVRRNYRRKLLNSCMSSNAP
jgi:hypothetical protein